jgi:hypothetical protein
VAGLLLAKTQPLARRSREDADAPWADKQSHNDQQDAEEHLTAYERDDAADHEHDRENPQDECHVVPP